MSKNAWIHLRLAGMFVAGSSFVAAQFPLSIQPICNVGKNALFYLPAERTCIIIPSLTEATNKAEEDERCWYTYAPRGRTEDVSASENGNERVPLVVDLHGYKGCAQWSPLYTGWKGLAEEHGFVVVWPQGHMEQNVLFSHTCWDAGPDCCCHRWKHEAGNDVEFLASLIAEVVASHPEVDPRRVYAAGHSNGCMMAQRLAAETANLVAAVACHSGPLVGDYADHSPSSSAASSPTPIMTIWGDADEVLPFGGGGSDGLRGAVESMEAWSTMNGCNKSSIVVDESNRFETHEWEGGDDCHQRMVKVYGVGHFPYKDAKFLLQKGTVVDTTEMAWEFVQQFSL